MPPMRINPALLSVSGAIAFSGLTSAIGQLVTITGVGFLEHSEEPERGPQFLPAEIAVSVTFLHGAANPVVIGAENATYHPTSASLSIDGEFFALHNAAFIIERVATDLFPRSGILFRGETADGWFFALQNTSSSS